MPEIPEIRAHAERLATAVSGQVLKGIEPLSFTAFKTVSPSPTDVVGQTLTSVGQRAKYLLLRFGTGELSLVVHLMQGGRLRLLAPDAKRPRKPRDGLARFEFESGLGLLLTEPGTQKRAGVWAVAGDPAAAEPLANLGPEADQLSPPEMAALLGAYKMRLHNFLRDQRVLSGLGRRLANEICHRAKLSPFASTRELTNAEIAGATDPADAADATGAAVLVQAIRACVDESLTFERQQPEMSRSADRPSAVHGRTGEPCPACGPIEGDVVRAVEFRDYTVNYCAACQTGGRILADNTTSKFLR